MKFSILPIALACTGLVASASPLRVIVVSNGNGNAPTLHGDPSLVAHLQPPRLTGADMKRPCGGARFRQKVSGFADSLKIAFGFSVSHNNNPHAAVSVGHIKPNHPPEDNKLHILPFIGTPNQFAGLDQSEKAHIAAMMRLQEHHRHGHGRFRHSGEQPSFLMRVHFALMSLGPWEGRAVAFVLGCGIGVLLRMFWVLVVITYRTIKGPSSHEDDGYTVIDVDAEEIFVAPPTYTYPVDEKVDVVEPVPVVVARAEEESK